MAPRAVTPADWPRIVTAFTTGDPRDRQVRILAALRDFEKPGIATAIADYILSMPPNVTDDEKSDLLRHVVHWSISPIDLWQAAFDAGVASVQ